MGGRWEIHGGQWEWGGGGAGKKRALERGGRWFRHQASGIRLQALVGGGRAGTEKYSAGVKIYILFSIQCPGGVVQRLSTKGVVVLITVFRLSSRLLAIFLYRGPHNGLGPASSSSTLMRWKMCVFQMRIFSASRDFEELAYLPGAGESPELEFLKNLWGLGTE